MNCKTHSGHTHTHGKGCGHSAVRHEDHVDYAHDGHLHHAHDGHVDEHILSYSGACGNGHDCKSHDAQHVHGPQCGHAGIPHKNHMDYVVAGHVHCVHGSHCDKQELVAA